MLLGHYGVALALKRAEPKLSLGTLFLGTQLLDLLWGIFLLLGWEQARIVPVYTLVTPLEFLQYPISHSLVGAICWSLVAAGVYYSWPTRDVTRHWQAAVVVGIVVLSHYPLDVLTHVPDLPLAGSDSPKLGLGLWNYPAATLLAELGFLAAGLAIYFRYRSHRHPVRIVRLAVLMLVLVGTYFASRFGPLPPDMLTVAVSDIVFVVAVAALAAWADRRATAEELHAHRLSPR